MGSVPAPDFSAGERSHRRGFTALAGCAFALLALGLMLCAPSGASATVKPGTPVSVAPGVPDQGRAWELVTSEDPVSALLWSAFGIASSGDRIVYSTFGLLPDAPLPEPLLSPALAQRGPGGWSNATLPVPDLDPQNLFEPAPLALGDDLEESIWASALGTGENGLFRSTHYGQYELAMLGQEGAASPSSVRSGFIGASDDLQRFAAESNHHLLPGDATRTEGASIYEDDASTLRLVDVAEDGTLLSDCGSTGEGPQSVSADGRRIFFSTFPGCGATRRVFLREDAATTTEISASQCTLPDCGPEASVEFVGATPAAGSAFLVTAQRLTDDDSDSNADLYRYEVADGSLSLVSATEGGEDLVASAEKDVQVATDGSRVYFAAAIEIGPGELSAARLYMADADGLHLVSSGPPSFFLQVSPSGRYAVFDTTGALLPSDTDASADVYRYDAQTEALTQISLSPYGGNGPFFALTKRTEFSFNPGYSSGISDYTSMLATDHPYRAMTDDGSRVFFITNESLLPADANDVVDVYEWTNGSLGLVSSGSAEAEGSDYSGSTPDGRTVLIGTGDTLLPRDRDGGDVDLYVARIGGGLPEPSLPAGCVESCRPASPPARQRPTPASSQAGPATIGVGKIGAAERRRFAATGWIELLVEVPRPGRLTAEATARLGGRRLKVAAAGVRARQAGPLQIRMRLSKRARAALAKHELQLQVRLRLSGLDATRRLGLRLGGGA